MRHHRIFPWSLALLFLCGVAAHDVRAQNPVQWSGNAKQAVDRAAEQSLPLLIWVKEGLDHDDDDLEDAQEDCFRDPVVVGMIHKHFVPLRVNRNSRVMEEAQKLGLPTGFGLYCAVLTHDGRLLDQMGPGEVAQPAVFAGRLSTAYAKFSDDLYEKEIRPLLEDPATPKPKARVAAQTVWRLGIRKADTAIIGLLARPDLQPQETARLYELLASLGTQASIGALLERAEEKAAAAALTKAEPGALEWLLPEMPGVEGEVSPKQLAAYTAAAKVCRTAAKGKEWWDSAKSELRAKEIERVQTKAETVVEFWRERDGDGR